MGYKLGLEAIGSGANNLTGYTDEGAGWTSRLSRSDGTYTGAGNIALHCYDVNVATMAADDFGGGTIGAAVTYQRYPAQYNDLFVY